MAATSQLVPTGFSLAAVLCWGTSDFIGGYASKRSDAFLVTLLAHASGLGLMAALSVTTHAPFPSSSSGLWAIAGGALGGVGLALLYRALASGSMGLTAPLAAVLGAALPAIFGIVTEGMPGAVRIAGFLLAGIGVCFISWPDDMAGGAEGLMLAALAGVGFAGFFICISRIGQSSALWSAAVSRFASLAVVAAIVLFRRAGTKLQKSAVVIAVVAGFLDSTGTALFIRAKQTGRLDTAVVLTSLYPAVTVLLARFVLKEHFTPWKAAGIFAALLAVPLIALQ